MSDPAVPAFPEVPTEEVDVVVADPPANVTPLADVAEPKKAEPKAKAKGKD